ncbi:amidase family protein [Kribbella jejuensis]|uniref:Mandelamide amidase n=1 Tax=Kribbella jejuensis TaxID=236068 RepID=A0A542ESD7_9ACTN|nr:amidase family protein [Kribbella jejuensis]TQJ18273.1 mandelamide amidase [Kribbella jejuensis]
MTHTDPSAIPSSNRQLTELGVAAAAAAIRRGDITAESYAAALLDQARAQSAIHSFATIDESSVLAAASAADKARAAGATAPLLGVPLGVKDSYQTKDLPTSLGLRSLKDFVPPTEAEVVTAIKGAGAIVFGKNNLVEMSYGVTGHNAEYGQVLNPYNHEHLTGGSSSGSAASVAARMVPASFGGDTVGSIRIPAALNGVVGYKPTTGRWPRGGVAPISHVLDTTGLLARHVEDVLLIDQVVTGRLDGPSVARPDFSRTRLAYAPKHHLALVDPEVERLFHETVSRIREAGAEVVEVDLGDDFTELADRTAWNLFLRDTYEAISAFLAENGYPVSVDDIYQSLKPQLHDVWSTVVVPGSPGYLSDEGRATTVGVDRPALQRRFAQVFEREGIDALIFPTTPAPAPRIADQWVFTVAGQQVEHLFLAKNTVPASGAGLPGISLPAGLTKAGLPVGIELNGPCNHDQELLALALQVDSVLPPLPSPV